jgi:FkbH-like protein
MNDLLARIRTMDSRDPGLLDDIAACRETSTADAAARLLAHVPPSLLVPPGRPVRDMTVAIVPTFTCDVLGNLLRVEMLRSGIVAEIRQSAPSPLLLGADSVARADVILVPLDEGAVWPSGVDPTALVEVAAGVNERWERLESALRGLAARTDGTVVINTVPLPEPRHRTLIAHASKAALGRLWRELNLRILALADDVAAITVLDFEMQLTDGCGPLRDDRLHDFGGFAWTPAVERRYATEAAAVCRAATGAQAKCLVLDLDGTLWGGVAGDDGPTGIELGDLAPGRSYTRVQQAALALRRQGVLLAVCSRNDPALVRQIFDEHPGMVLRAGDIAAWAVGWSDKDEAVAGIAAQLGISLDACVFADDTGAVCAQVAAAHPQLRVVHLGGDPADHVGAILAGGWFDVSVTTAEDSVRTQRYQARRERNRDRASQTANDVTAAERGAAEPSADEPAAPDRSGYLYDLRTRVTIRDADPFTVPRVAQLAARTNQFTLTGRPHSQGRTAVMAGSSEHRVLAIEAEDRFGPEGICGAVWLTERSTDWLIENWVMSCRVLSRGIESAVLAALAAAASEAGMTELTVVHQDTGRNGLASRFLRGSGFRPLSPEDPGPEHTLRIDRAPHAPEWIVVDAALER